MKRSFFADIINLNLILAEMHAQSGNHNEGRKNLDEARRLLCSTEDFLKFEPHYQLVRRRFNEVSERYSSEKLKVIENIIEGRSLDEAGLHDEPREFCYCTAAGIRPSGFDTLFYS